MNNESAFTVFYSDGYACLTVFPFSEAGRTVYPEEIIGRLKILGIHNVLRENIIGILEKQSGRPEPLVPWPDGAKLGPVIDVGISEDSMTAAVEISPEKQGGEPLSAKMIQDRLTENGIVFGIDSGVIETIVLKRIYRQKINVAFGLPAVDEQPPIAEYFFETDRVKPFRKLEFNRIDLKELNFIQNKKAGDCLARLGPPVPPADGTDIRGKTIHAKRGSAAVTFKAGAGTAISADGREITAETDGNVKLKDGTVVIEPLISVENVDYSNGNMDFNGSLDISGRIADGFTVKARGDVQIGKSVSKVDIASGGDVILKAGISGNDEGRIICGGDLYARYIENAIIICSGNIFVEEAVMHSDVKAGGDIVLTGKRAEIFGGRAAAGGSIICKKLGSLNEPVTDLFLGIDLDTFNRLSALQLSVKNNTGRINELDTKIRQLQTALKRNDNPEVSADKLTAALNQLNMESSVIRTKLNESVRLLHELRKEIELNPESRLDVENTIYPKVHVFFGDLRWDSPNKGTGKTSLLVKGGKLLVK